MPCVYCGSDKKIAAKGLCFPCYQRQWKTGSLEYKRLYQPKKLCSVEGCNGDHVAQGLCEKHYRMAHATGNPISNFGYGDRRKHPLYEVWRYQVRTMEGRDAEWDDFWTFVNDVGEKPERKCAARRYDQSKPWGKDNFFWLEYEYKSLKDREAIRKNRLERPMAYKKHEVAKNYGMSLEQYLELYESQGGKCAICKEPGEAFSTDKGRSHTLAVDHCHKTSKVRGLLCSRCNRGLGLFRDSVEITLSAAEFLKKYET